MQNEFSKPITNAVKAMRATGVDEEHIKSVLFLEARFGNLGNLADEIWRMHRRERHRLIDLLSRLDRQLRSGDSIDGALRIVDEINEVLR